MSQILEIKSKSIEDAIAKALEQLSVNRDDIEVEVIENPVKGFLGLIGNKEGKYKITVIEKEEPKLEKEVTETDVAREFVENIINNLSIDATVDVIQEKNVIKVNIKGKESACLIGRRGETLDSIQFLAGLALNKVNKDSHSRVLIDIENYRSKREESLIRYANKVAREVAKTKKTKKLDYMNPYERRIIHSTLQNDRFVRTYSEGTDPYRRLVIEYKK
ncbi:MAG: RNA-binding cell elongation regulator Jag/EloR [Paraclostridium sp.]